MKKYCLGMIMLASVSAFAGEKNCDVATYSDVPRAIRSVLAGKGYNLVVSNGALLISPVTGKLEGASFESTVAQNASFVLEVGVGRSVVSNDGIGYALFGDKTAIGFWDKSDGVLKGEIIIEKKWPMAKFSRELKPCPHRDR